MMRSVVFLALLSLAFGGRVHTSQIHRLVTKHTHANATSPAAKPKMLNKKKPEAKPVEAPVVAAPAKTEEAKPAEPPLVQAAAKKALRAAPAPAPAPITQADIIGDMKKKMAKKVGHYDADYVLDRPTTVPPGHDGQVAPGPKSQIVPNAPPPPKPAPGAPGAAPAAAAPAPAPVPDTGMSEAALNPLVKHNDNETMVDDWGAEYGPKGPRGVHGPYQPMGAMYSGASRNGLMMVVTGFVGLMAMRC